MNKLSARRKKSVFGRRTPRTSSIPFHNSECESRVENAKFDEPPSVFIPAATAIASSNVDLPLPFSPITQVTFGFNASPPRKSVDRRQIPRVPDALLVRARREQSNNLHKRDVHLVRGYL